MLYVTEWNGVSVDEKWIVGFAWNIKSFAITINFLFLVFSVANLDGLMKVSCRIFCICWATRALREKYLFQPEISCVKTWHAMSFKENIMAEVSGHKRACRYYVFHGVNSIFYTITNVYHKFRILLNVINVFCGENLALFTVTSIHSIPKS